MIRWIWLPFDFWAAGGLWMALVALAAERVTGDVALSDSI